MPYSRNGADALTELAAAICTTYKFLGKHQIITVVLLAQARESEEESEFALRGKLCIRAYAILFYTSIFLQLQSERDHKSMVRLCNKTQRLSVSRSHQSDLPLS